MIKRKFLPLATAVSIMVGTSNAAHLTVSQNCNDCGHYPSIQSAIDAAKQTPEADTISIHGDTPYAETIVFDNCSDMHIQGVGEVVLTAKTLTPYTDYLITIKNQSQNLSFANLSLQWAQRGVYIAHSPNENTDGSSNISFENIVGDTLGDGIYVGGGNDYLNFKNITMRNMDTQTGRRGSGLIFRGHYRTGAMFNEKEVIRGNRISNITIKNVDITKTRGMGIYLQGEIDNVVIDSASVSYCGWRDPYENDLRILDGYENSPNVKLYKYGTIDGIYAGYDNPYGHGFIYVPSHWDLSQGLPNSADQWWSANNVKITNSDISYASRQGINIYDAHYTLIKNTRTHHNGASGIQMENDARYFVVEECLADSNQQINSTETGIWVDDCFHGVVRNNRTDFNQVGLEISGSGDIIAHSNLITNSSKYNHWHKKNTGILLTPNDTFHWTLVDTVYVINNTVVGVGNDTALERAGIKLNSYWNKPWRYNIKNSVVLNNIVKGVHTVDNNNASMARLGEYDSLTMDNNMYGDLGDKTVFWQKKDDHSSHFWTLYDMQNQTTGFEEHSLQLDAQFTDEAGGDYSLAGSVSGMNGIDQGRWLTKVTSSGSNSNRIPVENALFFTDGYSFVTYDGKQERLSTGDIIRIGDDSGLVITEIDSNVLVVDKAISWDITDSIAYNCYGTAPDMGAFEKLIDVEAPQSPQNLRAENVTNTSAMIVWDPAIDNSGSIDFYTLKIVKLGGSDTTTINLTVPAFNVINLDEYAMHLCLLTATDAAGNESSIADMAFKTKDFTPPTMPTNLTGSALGNIININWTPSSDIHSGLLGYYVQYREEGCRANIREVNLASAHFNDLKEGTNYLFSVKAVDMEGNESLLTDEITIQTEGGVPAWATNVPYSVGDTVTHNGQTWVCSTNHTSQASWYPGAPGVYLWSVQQ